MLKEPPKTDTMPRRTVIIKRYQNRKLYDTQNSTYVTLEDIGITIRRGDDVRVIDNKTKEDLTSVTLTQIIFEEEKKHKNSLPLNALKKIIRGGGDAIMDLVSKTSDNVQTTLNHVKEGAETIYDKLRDELTPDDNIIKEVLNKTQNMTKNIEDKIKSTVGGIAHTASLQGEVRKLRQRILFLEKKLKVYEKK